MFSKVFRRNKSPHQKDGKELFETSVSPKAVTVLHNPYCKTTPSGEAVVSLVVEILACAELGSGNSSRGSKVDPYVKVKFAKSIHRQGGTSVVSVASAGSVATVYAGPNIHKTKVIHQTNNPSFTTESHSGFCIDGLSVKDFNASQGLLFKVKNVSSSASKPWRLNLNLFNHGGKKEELGFVHVLPEQIFSQKSQDGNMALVLMHSPTTTSGQASTGTITIRCRPAEKSDILFYKQWGLGYFGNYDATAAPTASAVTTDVGRKDDNLPAVVGIGSGSSPSMGGDSVDNEALTVATSLSVPNSPKRSPNNDGANVPNTSEDNTGGLVNGILKTISSAFSASESTSSLPGVTGEEIKDLPGAAPASDPAFPTSEANRGNATKDDGSDTDAENNPYKDDGDAEDVFGQNRFKCADDCFTDNCVIS